MRIAFYAPLKSPSHPVPSGDRLMARQLVRALQMAGHAVDLASELRSYCPDPDDRQTAAAMAAGARAEVVRLTQDWRLGGAPDVWLCYHPYYKSPDLIGQGLAQVFDIPYITIESSYSARRNLGVWAQMQAGVLAGLKAAAVNICLTHRDRDGILAAAPKARVAHLPPFIDPAPFAQGGPVEGPLRLVTVAMMRPGDKFDSYGLLARALRLLPVGVAWQLTVVGGGAMRGEVEALFTGLKGRVIWAGAADQATVARHLAQADVYVWPGFGEAYGLAYLEAQAAGLPVVAQHIAGVPEVVADGETGFLTAPGDTTAYAAMIGRLASDIGLRHRMGAAARARVLSVHSLDSAAVHLDAILGTVRA